MNLQTGETEAKLLDSGKKTAQTALTSVTDTKEEENEISDDVGVMSTTNILTHDEVKKALQNMTGDDVEVASEEDIARVKQKFRSYEVLKKEFKDLKMAVKTDMELMHELLSKYKGLSAEADDEDKVTILTDLEYLVHQIDNAQEFARIGGLTDIVYPSMNTSSGSVRAEAIRLLGSAASSNPKVQISALEGGGLHLVLRVLALDRNEAVRARAVYALSCLVRRFPAAQGKMVAEGGLSVLASLFKSEQQEDLKLQVKVVTLLYDLIQERVETKLSSENLSPPENLDIPEKLRQYKAIDLEGKLVQHGWCKRLPKLLLVQSTNEGRAKRRDDLISVVGKDLPVRPEHDVVEKVVSAMVTLSDICAHEFADDGKVKAVLLDLKVWYDDLASREELENKSRNETDDHSFYYTNLASLITNMTRILGAQSIKDEL
uniref:Nucleotide exchange factor SIL1 n=1 Tax=Timema bartmani TaxID=61472 RepID=A0A7R9I022_9NEOP|nr:unnamed protein product [Timema bartmani]